MIQVFLFQEINVEIHQVQQPFPRHALKLLSNCCSKTPFSQEIGADQSCTKRAERKRNKHCISPSVAAGGLTRHQGKCRKSLHTSHMSFV